MKILSFALILLLTLSFVSIAAEKKLEIKVDGMACANCVNKVKTSLEKLEGVKSAEVSLDNHSAVVVYDDSKTNEAAIKTAVNSAGFKAVELKAACAGKAGCCATSANCGACDAKKK
jgi:mercuric transport protein